MRGESGCDEVVSPDLAGIVYAFLRNIDAQWRSDLEPKRLQKQLLGIEDGVD
jgi:hypothetical protein